MAKRPTQEYENNPFYIGLNGLKLFFQNAQSIAIYTIVVSVVSVVVSFIANLIQSLTSPERSSSVGYHGPDTAAAFSNATPLSVLTGIIVVLAFFFVILAIVLLIFGVGDYASARLARGEKVDLKEAFLALLKHFPGYVWVNVVMIVKILLWSLLFIVPGIIMAVRYRLAGTVYFAEGLRGNAAVKRSAQLTKGAWLTTFAGFSLWNIITQGLMKMVLAPGVNAILYRQLRDLTDSDQPKPAAHWLSWLTLLVPIVFVVFIFMIVALLFVLLLALHTAP